MSKQTAVEWLYERLERMIPRSALYNMDKKQYFEKAKEMEKQQMCQFAFDYQDEFFNNGKVLPIEQYYNETYGGDK